MRQLSFVGLAFGVIAAAAAFVVVHDLPQSAEANHSAPGSADTHIVHVHDNYFHPEPLTGPWADHNAAMTDCQVAGPPPQCDMTIDVGDSVEWWTKSPFAQAPHTVTECTDNTFSTCGAAVAPANPIGDSGVFAGGAVSNTLRYGPITFTAAGTYYYRCDVHLTTMRGRVLVQALTTPPAGDPVVGGSARLIADSADPAKKAFESGSAGSDVALAVVAVAVIVVAVTGAGLWRRAAVRKATLDERDCD
ncbi:MAG TPA: hypothetical protein VGR43_09420 [Dehalococcoidia bacterium]|jgi:plastocyanin|nr:hypothetical protein [Dehalococcoidia bacterium]